MSKPTIKSLKADVEAGKARETQSHAAARSHRERMEAAEASAKETREQFADLKKRLHNSEMEVARLNGYLARVHEDDTVREDFLTVGEPDGQQRLVPKRKHGFLGNQEPDYTRFDTGNSYIDDIRNRKPKHWIEY